MTKIRIQLSSASLCSITYNCRANEFITRKKKQPGVGQGESKGNRILWAVVNNATVTKHVTNRPECMRADELAILLQS